MYRVPSILLRPLPRVQNVVLRPGDYAVVNVRETSGITLRGSAVARTTLTDHAALSGGDWVQERRRPDPTAIRRGGGDEAAEVSEGPGVVRAFV